MELCSSQDAEGIVAENLQGGAVHEENASNEIFIRRLDSSMRRSLCKYWSAKMKATLHHHAFHGTFLLKLQEKEIESKRMNQISAEQGTTKNLAPHWKSTWASFWTGVHIIKSERASGLSTVSRNCSRTSLRAIDAGATRTEAIFSLIASMDLLFTTDSAPFCRVSQH